MHEKIIHNEYKWNHSMQNMTDADKILLVKIGINK